MQASLTRGLLNPRVTPWDSPLRWLVSRGSIYLFVALFTATVFFATAAVVAYIWPIGDLGTAPPIERTVPPQVLPIIKEKTAPATKDGEVWFIVKSAPTDNPSATPEALLVGQTVFSSNKMIGLVTGAAVAADGSLGMVTVKRPPKTYFGGLLDGKSYTESASVKDIKPLDQDWDVIILTPPSKE
jgi:hypothetical protein